MRPPLETIILFSAIAAASPVLASLVGRFARVPLVVFEIALGVVLGPSVLGWIAPDTFTAFLANIGLAMLFFLAGNEIDFASVSGRPLGLASLGWLVSLAVGIGLGILVGGSIGSGVFLGIALTSTALGAILPVLRDAGELGTPFGRVAVATGAVGEFGPLIAISLFLSGRSPLAASVVLLGFVLLAIVAVWLAARGAYPPLHRLIAATLHTSGQFAVRMVMLILAALTCLSIFLGLDMLLGAFTAGVLARLLLANARSDAREDIESKVEAVGFGFLVPIFFVSTGVGFPLAALLGDPAMLLLVPVFLALLLVVRGGSALLALPRAAPWRERGALALFGGTGLPIIVAVTALGVRSHDLSAGMAAALVGAGMLSVLLFPLLALVLRSDRAPQPVPAGGD